MSTGRTRILIDAGLSRRETTKRLAAIGEDIATLNAILITHEHSDHIVGLDGMARAFRIPVHTTALTAPTLAWTREAPPMETFHAGASFTIGDLEVDSFTIPHDAIDPVGFCIRAQGLRIGIVTDLGYVPDSIPYHLRQTDLLVLESNHDLEMLKVGPYPWPLKQRVMGRKGHLSNDVASSFIHSHLCRSTQVLILGHLSEHNNHPEIARQQALRALAERCRETRLVVAEPRKQSEVFCL